MNEDEYFPMESDFVINEDENIFHNQEKEVLPPWIQAL